MFYAYIVVKYFKSNAMVICYLAISLKKFVWKFIYMIVYKGLR